MDNWKVMERLMKDAGYTPDDQEVDSYNDMWVLYSVEKVGRTGEYYACIVEFVGGAFDVITRTMNGTTHKVRYEKDSQKIRNLVAHLQTQTERTWRVTCKAREYVVNVKGISDVSQSQLRAYSAVIRFCDTHTAKMHGHFPALLEDISSVECDIMEAWNYNASTLAHIGQDCQVYWQLMTEV